MKRILTVSLILLLSFSAPIFASTPTESLKIAVDQLIAVAADKTVDDVVKKSKLSEIIQREVDFEAVSKRVVSKSWRKATDEQKKQFKAQFLTIMVDTYFVLLKNYSNEEVIFSKEQIKKDKYAIVDTKILSESKKIPVRYRLIKVDNSWKIYDFIPEGVSLVNSYKNNYVPILKKEGLQGLLKNMVKAKGKKSKD